MLKLRNILLNSKAAIDLASIMVGIIVIGLIGGVIAATVFAVIPWAQDNAAKEQLESIHTAQNAAYGFSADPSRTMPEGQQRNSFTNSIGLDAGYGFLIEGATYCTVQSSDGQDYTGYSLSGSGKIWFATNSDKKAKIHETGASTLPEGCEALKEAAGSDNNGGDAGGPVVLNPGNGYGDWDKDATTQTSCTISETTQGLVMDITSSRPGCRITQSFDTRPGTLYEVKIFSYGTRGQQTGWGDDAGVLTVKNDVPGSPTSSTTILRNSTTHTTANYFTANDKSVLLELHSQQHITNQNLPYKHTFTEMRLTPVAEIIGAGHPTGTWTRSHSDMGVSSSAANGVTILANRAYSGAYNAYDEAYVSKSVNVKAGKTYTIEADFSAHATSGGSIKVTGFRVGDQVSPPLTVNYQLFNTVAQNTKTMTWTFTATEDNQNLQIIFQDNNGGGSLTAKRIAIIEN